jgi:hypothetical protein
MVLGQLLALSLLHLQNAKQHHQFKVDSDLEAFSHNPSDDSFASLSVQINAIPNIRINGKDNSYANITKQRGKIVSTKEKRSTKCSLESKRAWMVLLLKCTFAPLP